MNRQLLWMLAAMLVCCVGTKAQERSHKRTFMEKVVAFLDSSNVRNTDPAYIGLPQRPWRIIASSGTDQMNMKLDVHDETEATQYQAKRTLDYSVRVRPPVATSIGLWAGYRGWGLGYSLSVTGNKGINMALNISTPSNGVNIRVRRFDFSKPERQLNVYENNELFYSGYQEEELGKPMKVESFVFDGYWIFNKKRFSLAAAYDQSTRQLRSAGSLIAGAMFYYQKLDYASKYNMSMINLTGNTGKIKLYQGSIGLGYTYNWVPAPKWVINGVCMPVVMLLNTGKIFKYKMVVPPGVSVIDVDDPWAISQLVHTDDVTFGGRIGFNIDLRMSVSYWYRRWFFCLIGQAHSFNATFSNSKLRMNEWDIKASIGLLL